MAETTAKRARTDISPEEALNSARRVLGMEAQALQRMAETLDGAFIRAVEMMAAAEGRVVVTGMGKSGHIGRKIAATLASTGTPAMFVHPGEASHGDLGMITRQDCVLAISNSGETPELGDIVAYTRRFSIPLLAIVGKRNSTIAKAADCVLYLPEAEEACPMGLAPTTSTTATLALGDALAVALLERWGFTPEQFRVYHPGGKLGKSLIRVGDIMHGAEDMPVIAPDAPMSEVLLTMTARRFGCAGVLDRDGALVGIVTDGDLRRHMGDDLLQARAADIMTPSPRCVAREALAAEALGIMNEQRITVLFVVEGDDNHPVGIVHMHDILRAGVY